MPAQRADGHRRNFRGAALERKFVRPASVRVEWQLYELDSGEFERCPPKDDSYRTVDTPKWLSGLVASHIARTESAPCPCHEHAYVFRGHGPANGAARHVGAKLVESPVAPTSPRQRSRTC